MHEAAKELPVLHTARLGQGFSGELCIKTVLNFFEQPQVFERDHGSDCLLPATENNSLSAAHALEGGIEGALGLLGGCSTHCC